MKIAATALALSFALTLGMANLLSVPVEAADATTMPVAAASDADITAAVQAALAAQPTLQGQAISVSTQTNSKGEKEVTLKGTVSDQQMMVTAGMAAEQTPGVKYVLNDITPEDYLREQAAKK